MKTLMLDTSAYAAFMRGHLEAISALRKAQSVIIPIVAMGELLAGFEVGSRRQKNRAELKEFLSSPRVRVVDANQETSERYALIYAYLRGVGQPVPTNDLWIAASAMEHSATLLTADAHFLHIPQIIVTHI
ncbi:MAG: type II toxin-antitoxin system VapC family toxin [Chloroflexota bacterium]|nr:type II toxin-antitoxin system VapC family toxin [Chloroflexota bacterium]